MRILFFLLALIGLGLYAGAAAWPVAAAAESVPTPASFRLRRLAAKPAMPPAQLLNNLSGRRVATHFTPPPDLAWMECHAGLPPVPDHGRPAPPKRDLTAPSRDFSSRPTRAGPVTF